MTRERLGDFMQVAIAAFISATVACCAMKCHGGNDTPPETIVKTDTVTVVHYDTITAYKPVPFNVYVVDTMWVPVTVNKTDTILVDLPRTAKVYQDSTYRAKVTGYDPVLEEIEIYQKTKIVTVHETAIRYKMDRLTFGLNAGYGLSGAGFSPYIGVGVSYNLFSLDLNKK